jgi:hypothetical protein
MKPSEKRCKIIRRTPGIYFLRFSYYELIKELTSAKAGEKTVS